MIIRCRTIGQGTHSDPFRVDLPTYTVIATDEPTRRALCNVPDVDVPAEVAAFVSAYPVSDLVMPLPSPMTPGLAAVWREHLARRYNLGNARWNPEIA